MTATHLALSAVAAALHAAPVKPDVRYYLNGLHCDPDGYLVGTDGHVLVAIRTEIPAAVSGMILPADPLRRAVKAVRPKLRSGLQVPVTVTDGLPRMELPGGTIETLAPVDGRFPDWRRIVPSRLPAGEEAATFDPALLTRVADSFRAWTGSDFPPQLYQRGEAAAIATAPDFLALVMPMRSQKLGGLTARDYARALTDFGCRCQVEKPDPVRTADAAAPVAAGGAA